MVLARNRISFGLVFAVLALGGLTAVPAMAANVSCAVEARSPAGPGGDVLSVIDTSPSVTHIYREDDAIVVFNNADSDPAVCAGGAPTVFDVDRIVYSSASGVPFVNYLGDGPLGPGATAEPGEDEIEVSIDEDYKSKVLNVAGTAQSEEIDVGQLGRRTVGVNLNAQADGAAQDADVTLGVNRGDELTVKVVARGGGDTLSASGRAFSGVLSSAERLSMSGGPGDDVLNGGPFRDLLSGDTGNDKMIGGRGRDHLAVGPGRDLANGGKGSDLIVNRSSVGGIPDDLLPDRIFGGPGEDSVDVAQELAGDQVDCGPGRDDAFRDRGDLVRGCEDVSAR
ncbi:MAG: calcium-binding protein [Solirubrobacterales bacterium]